MREDFTNFVLGLRRLLNSLELILKADNYAVYSIPYFLIIKQIQHVLGLIDLEKKDSTCKRSSYASGP